MTERYPDRGFLDDGPLEDPDTNPPQVHVCSLPEIAAVIREAIGDAMDDPESASVHKFEWNGPVFVNPPWEPEAIRTWIARAFLD
jgi:hypothetical protein